MSDWTAQGKKRPKRRWWAVAARPISSSSLVLDNLSLPALAAYSLRKVRGSYSGAAVNIRRSTDNATQDIGFVGNSFDVTGFSNFIGGGTGFVAIWYDQQGSANATAIGGLTANQSPIALAVTPSGKVAISSTATNQGMVAATAASPAIVSMAMVANRTGGLTSNPVPISFDGGCPGIAYNNSANTGFIFGNVGVVVTSNAVATDNAFHSAIGVCNGAATQVTTELGTVGTGNITGGTGAVQIDLIGRSGFGFVGYLAEAIVWNGALGTGDQTAVFTDQRAYYGY